MDFNRSNLYCIDSGSWLWHETLCNEASSPITHCSGDKKHVMLFLFVTWSTHVPHHKTKNGHQFTWIEINMNLFINRHKFFLILFILIWVKTSRLEIYLCFFLKQMVSLWKHSSGETKRSNALGIKVGIYTSRCFYFHFQFAISQFFHTFNLEELVHLVRNTCVCTWGRILKI